MFIIKWKKRQGGAIMLLGDGESTARGKGGPSSGLLGIEGSRGGEGGGGDMTQHQRSVPFAIPAALASLTGGNGNNSNNKRLMGGGERSSITAAGQAQTGSGEKGFYRVSGKKLVSVLESGGDGYSDPDPANDRRYTINNNFSNDDNDHLHVGGVRDSVLSTNSYYRDSIAFPDGAGDLSAQQPQRLQLGSPMRPESGVMVMRSGPMRTPVQQQGYFLDAPAQEQQRPLTPPINVVDPLGRSLVARDGSSRGSESRARFVEDM
ncbi:hypothetical protein B0T17DRAFT_40484 [Bombardia bombarda]|uniref:Uncharacterized protein n=1 Tax=Bombardia bombarda TaxID=252184 RepID=A0AA40CFD8_9PEZI|nr:hypothetical protein B0T17DRAFT_40484 [Bombardia bombarda]